MSRPQALWFSSDGRLAIDLNVIASAKWVDDDMGDEPDLEVVYVTGEPLYCSLAVGNELMAALRRHAQWPEGSPYRG